MKPLDQIDRDETKGNCYWAALEFIKNPPGLPDGVPSPVLDDVRLIHGEILKNEKLVRHAWIEVGENVYDYSNKMRLIRRKETYYPISKSRPFNRREADAILMHFFLREGKYPIGYWGMFTDEQVSEYLSSYVESEGPFAKNVQFCDLTDISDHEMTLFPNH